MANIGSSGLRIGCRSVCGLPIARADEVEAQKIKQR